MTARVSGSYNGVVPRESVLFGRGAIGEPGTVHVGIDVGAVALKTAVVDLRDDEPVMVETSCVRTLGRPLDAVRDALVRLADRFRAAPAVLALTGSLGRRLAEILNRPFVNEIVAQARAASIIAPSAGTIIEIGGASSRLIRLARDDAGTLSVEDFAMNAICAAGTGSFLDQQATRLGLTIEQFADLALKSPKPPRVAGRCSVFAKSDMIHLQQQGAPDYDIVAGLCFAMARSVKGALVGRRDVDPPVAFTGGVAANAGLVRALRAVLDLDDSTLFVPEHFTEAGALGAALQAAADNAPAAPIDPTALDGAAPEEADRARPLAPLADNAGWTPRRAGCPAKDDASAARGVYVGVDVGSISTNVVALDPEGRLVAKSYLMTQGRPLEAVRRGLGEVGAKLPSDVTVLGAATTGSGRYLTGDFLGADVVRNEITAQARGAVAVDSDVDTIFEIGGQDSKFIRLEGGVVVDFEMNHACAAGTGSFLEEQAERLGISIREEFARIALAASRPVRLGERCTVFMETDLLARQHAGASTDELVAGLAYSIVTNYLNRVVGHRKIGERIFFQGGTASNAAVVAAFEKVTGRDVFVPQNHEVTGAIGAALLARETMLTRPGAASAFRGFDLAERPYTLSSFECDECANRCEVKRVEIQDEAPLFYGSRCDKYNVSEDEPPAPAHADLFAERERLLTKASDRPTRPVRDRPPGGRIGIPRGLVFHELLPFWSTFLTSLGWEVVLSEATSKTTIRRGVERAGHQMCFPVKVMHGHVAELLARDDVDRIFLPAIIRVTPDVPDDDMHYLCPFVQSIPRTVRAGLADKESRDRLISPVVHFDERLERDVTRLARQLGCRGADARRALASARGAQRAFRRALRERGNAFLDGLREDERAVVLVSRPYNGCDPALSLDLPAKLERMGLPTIPVDMLPLEGVGPGDDWDNMFWRYGRLILSAARLIRTDPRLFPVYVSNFSCGPDSFLTTFFKKVMGEKPSLVLEIDEHSADAGVVTRLEAFFDSLHGNPVRSGPPTRVFSPAPARAGDRVLFIPRMSDHALAFAAAFRTCGMESLALPPSDEESLALGRRFTSGRECLPAIITAGDMIKMILSPGFDPERSAFFMPSGTGPCRFGQYNKLHRLVLQELGFPDIPVISPNQGKSFYDDFRALERDPTRLAWRALVAVDVLYKARGAVRPYETTPGDTDRVFDESIASLCECIESDGDLVARMKRLAANFRAVETSEPRTKPVIGIVGEIYVRSHAFSNRNIVADLERLGVEVDLALFAEWLYYTNFTRLRRNARERDAAAWGRNLLKDRVQKLDERLLARPFRGILRERVEPPTRKLLRLGGRYMDDAFEGEAILTVAKSIEHFHRGAAGVVNVMPFTCMPGAITSAVLSSLRDEHDGFPVLNVSYDGQPESNYETRLEAFVHQATAFHASRSGPVQSARA